MGSGDLDPRDEDFVHRSRTAGSGFTRERREHFHLTFNHASVAIRVTYRPFDRAQRHMPPAFRANLPTLAALNGHGVPSIHQGSLSALSEQTLTNRTNLNHNTMEIPGCVSSRMEGRIQRASGSKR
jgi:hypothetical protein